MRKFFIAFSILATSVFGGINLDITSFKADFIQQIDDKENKIVKYEGKIYAKKPSFAHWSYIKPISKEVYIDEQNVVVIEPDLEQAIIRKIYDDFNIFKLLKSAKKIKNGVYISKYKDTTFKIFIDGKNIQKLQYKDNFDNLVTITFKNQKYNIKLDEKLFEANIPEDYDTIIE